MRTLSSTISRRLFKKLLITLVCRISRYCLGLGLALLVLIMGLPVVSLAKNSAKPMKFEYVFDIGGEPGFAIIQDRDGFLWFSSFYNGMLRFDGSSKWMIREGPDGISNDFVTQLFEDRDGNIWAGTNNGLNRYDKRTNTITRFFDGYTATREIRKDKNFKDLPIIAMTAHAMAGDEDKSLQAGMNGHVTKPIDPDQLFATLQKWIKPVTERTVVRKSAEDDGPAEPAQTVPVEEELPESLSGFDLADGLKRLQGNKKLYRKLLLSFATDYNTVANEISQALDAEDFDQAHSLVHNLKGLAGNLAAMELQAAAVNLEKLVKGVETRTPPVKELNLKFSDLEDALNQALESAQSLGASAEEIIGKLSAEALADIPTELSQDIAKRIRGAAEMGDVTTLNAIAEEIKDQSDSCMLLSKQIIQMAEDFDLDGIQKLANDLDAC